MRSLRQSFQRKRGTPALSQAALVLIDFQHAFVDPAQPTFLEHGPAALAHARILLRAFRAQRLPVVFTRHAHRNTPSPGGMGSWWSRFLLEGDASTQLTDGLVAAEGELVVRKEHYSAFQETQLERWLRERDTTTVVLCGVMTHVCVDSTAREAFARGFNVVVAEDACASKHPSLHESSLLCLSHAVAHIRRTSSLSRLLAQQGVSR